jgi:hypothetical protein
MMRVFGENKMTHKIITGILGLFFICAVSLSNAATVSVLPSSLDLFPGQTIILPVTGSGFANLVTSGSITLTWDSTLLNLETTPNDAAAQGVLNTGFARITTFNLSPGQLDFSASVIPGALAIGPDFDFINLIFTVIGASSTASRIDILAGPDGAWQDQSFQDYADVTYLGSTITDTVFPAVPVTSAVWLFGSGLLGLVGVARCKKT